MIERALTTDLTETWLAGLVKVSRRIADMDDVDAVLRSIAAIARELMNADTASLALVESQERLALRFQADSIGDFQPEAEWITAPVIRSALEAPTAFCYSPLPEDPPLSWSCAGNSWCVSNAALMPLLLDTIPIGVLWVGRLSDRPFTATELAGLGHLADQMVIALEHGSMAARLQSLAVIEERSRIAREMHDSLAQILGYLGLQMQTLEVLALQGNIDSLVVELRQARELIKAAHADIRSNILSLRTTLAGDLGFVAALRQYLDEFAIQTGLKASLTDSTSSALTLSPLAETQLVRIIQEALNNVRKHARASQVVVRIATRDHSLFVSIVDDGIGMVVTNDSHKHFGLQTMLERAESVGGGLSVTSAPGLGTTVVVHAPLL